MTASGMHDLQAVERELSSLPPYRMPEEPRRSLRARLVSEASGQRAPVLGWLGIALGRAAALTAAMILLLSGVAWAVVASAPGDPLYVVKDAIIRLVGTSASEIRPVPTGEESPVTIPDALPADLLAPPSIAPSETSEAGGRPTATEQPASRTPEPTTSAVPATAGPSSPAHATPAVPPSPPGPRATPAVPPPRP